MVKNISYEFKYDKIVHEQEAMFFQQKKLSTGSLRVQVSREMLEEILINLLKWNCHKVTFLSAFLKVEQLYL